MTAIPEIVEVRIVRRTTHQDGNTIRPHAYAFSEILMTSADGRHYCSRTWEEIADSPFARAHQVEQFKRRMAASQAIS